MPMIPPSDFWKRSSSAAIGLVGILLLSGCQSGPQFEIRSAFGPGIRFSQIGSAFDWFPAELQRPDAAHAPIAEVDRLIRDLTEDELRSKGFVKVSDDGADFWIDYRVATATRGTPYGDSAFNEYQEGTVVIYVIDPDTRRWIWRVSATAKLHESSTPAERKERLQAAIGQMFKDVPPRGEKKK
jgi:hypothetical protein